MPPITHRDCRALRHAWERLDGPPEGWSRPDSDYWSGARYIVHLRCLRCSCYRHIAMTHTGGRLANAYTYPDDYLRPKGEPRVDPDRLRLWLAVPGRWK